jgi:hypothetical protein
MRRKLVIAHSTDCGIHGRALEIDHKLAPDRDPTLVLAPAPFPTLELGRDRERERNSHPEVVPDHDLENDQIWSSSPLSIAMLTILTSIPTSP